MGELLHGGLAWAHEAVTHTKVLAQTNYTHPAEHKNNDTYKYIQLLMPMKLKKTWLVHQKHQKLYIHKLKSTGFQCPELSIGNTKVWLAHKP